MERSHYTPCRGRYAHGDKVMYGHIKEINGEKGKTYYLQLRWQGRRYYLSRDKRGDRFESHAHAERFQGHISELIASGEFDINDWLDERPWAFKHFSGKWLRHYEDLLRMGEISPSTMREKRRLMRDYFLPFFGEMDIRRVRAGTIEDFVAQLPDHLSPKSRKNLVIDLRAFFGWLFQREEIQRIPPFPKIRWDRPPIEYMPEEDWIKVLECIPEADRPLFITLRMFGLRPGEACALQWDCFNWRDRTFEVRRTFSYGENGWELVERAKAGSNGILPITPEFDQILKQVGKGFQGFVFRNQRGEHYTQRQYDRIWRQACKRAGVPYRKPYQASRTSFACEGLRAGLSYEEVGSVLRHTDPRTTRFYGRIFTDHKAEVIARLSPIYRQKIGGQTS